MITEIWKSVKDATDYEISNHGRLRRDGRILKPYIEASGYLQYTLSLNGKNVKRRAHNLVVEAFVEGFEKKQAYCVNHKDGNKANNVIVNLEYGTYGDNNKHAYRTGLKQAPRGERSGMAKLTNSEVLAIYNQAHQKDTTNPEVGRRFGISAAEVSLIKVGLRWQHITGHRRSA